MSWPYDERSATRIGLAAAVAGALLLASCGWSSPSRVRAPEFSSRAPMVYSATAERLKTEGRVRARPVAQQGRPSLPSGLEPDAPPRSWRYVVLHHTATDSGSVAQIDQVHRTRRDAAGNPWLGIGYHFVIGNGEGMRDGLIEPTFRWQRQLHGAHAASGPHNELGIGICLVGDFTTDHPTKEQVAALESLTAALTARYSIPVQNVVQHRDIIATDCPGANFPFDELIANLQNIGAPEGGPGTEIIPQVETTRRVTPPSSGDLQTTQ